MKTIPGLTVLKSPAFALSWCVLAAFSYYFIDLKMSIYQHQIVAHDYPLFISIFSKITLLGISTPYIIISALIFLWGFFFQKNKTWLWATALYLLMAIVISGIVCDTIKFLLGRARPINFFSQQLYGFYFWQFSSRMQSFPSGHSTIIAALGTALVLLLPAWRWFFFLVIILVAVSRVIVGAHYLSDIMIGTYLGFIVAQGLYGIFRKKLIYSESFSGLISR